MNTNKKSFWVSLKGIITIIISLMAAAGTLIGSLHAIGVFSENETGNEEQVVLTITISGEGGTTNPGSGSYVYRKGSVISLTAISDSGFEFERWTGDISSTSPTLSIDVIRDMVITAEFKPLPDSTSTTSSKPASEPISEPVSDQIPSVSGTTWAGTNSKGEYYEYHFQQDGSLHYQSPSGYWENGTWAQSGNEIYMEMNNRYAEYQGIITGNKMEGNAWNVKGHHWTWTAEIQ